MLKRKLFMLAAPVLMVAGTVSHAQDHRDFHNGLRDGGRNGQYYDQRRGDQGYYHNDPRYNQHQGGIGPGKGALIGAGGGALLGGLLGGGLKGSLIGGAAGAGIGAIAGKAHQDNQRRDNGYYRR